MDGGPGRKRSGLPLQTSHTRTVPSVPAEARLRPSVGWKATSVTAPVCPRRVRYSGARLPLHGGGVPDPDGLIDARRGELVAVGAEGHAEDVVDVAAQREDFLPGRRVPELDGLIQARGREAAAVGAEGHAPEPARRGRAG